MFRQQQRGIFVYTKQPQTLIVRIPRKKKLSLEKILQNSFHRSSKKKHFKDELITPPIHTSVHIESHRDRRTVENQGEQIPDSYRKIQARISKHNEFNRRIFNEHSPTKESLLYKNAKKNIRSLKHFNFQNVIQHSVTKKNITTKSDAKRSSLVFWENVKEKIEKEDSVTSTMKYTQKVEEVFSKRKDLESKNIQDDPPSLSQRKYLKKSQDSRKKSKKKQKVTLDELTQVRPWNHTRKMLTLPEENRDPSRWLDQQF